MSGERSLRCSELGSGEVSARQSLPTVAEALEDGRDLLGPFSGPDARREALYLLAGVLGATPGEAAVERDRRLDTCELSLYRRRLARRAAGEPLQYIEGRAAFRNLDLRIDRSVLIPRPETEELVERVLEWSAGRRDLSALDLGTGSGAIAISLALEGPFARVLGVDISSGALNVARSNATGSGAGVKVELRQGSLFDALCPDERFHVIVSNPPYVALDEAESLPEEVREWEPHVALYAGTTGLEVIVAIVAGAAAHLERGGLLALETAPHLAARSCELVRASGSFDEPRLLADLAGRPRIVVAEGVGA